jgi:hypothetical protein
VAEVPAVVDDGGGGHSAILGIMFSTEKSTIGNYWTMKSNNVALCTQITPKGEIVLANGSLLGPKFGFR